MEEMQTEELARRIVASGKLIQELVYRSQSECLASTHTGKSCGDLSMPQYHALMIVRRRGRLTIGEMARLLRVSAPSTSTMVDRLVEKGCLQRMPDPDDRRRVVVSVAPEALKDIERVEDALTRAFSELLEAIGPETSRQWYDVLTRVTTVLEARD